MTFHLTLLTLLLALFPALPVSAQETDHVIYERKSLTIHPRLFQRSLTFRVRMIPVARDGNPRIHPRLPFDPASLEGTKGALFTFDSTTEYRQARPSPHIKADLVFFNSAGRIVLIIHHGGSHSGQPVPLDEPVQSILAIAPGIAATYGLSVGDQATGEALRKISILP